MPEQQKQVEKKENKYFLGEIGTQTAEGRLMQEVIAKPDGTALVGNQLYLEILNNQLKILTIMKKRL